MVSAKWQVQSRVMGWLMIGVAAVALTACGSGAATSTPVPASVVRPDQPTPVYPGSTAFALLTPTAAPVFVTGTPAMAAVVAGADTSAASLPLDPTLFQPPPTALGIVRGGATLFDQPVGTVLRTLPAGAAVTLTGKTADGAWLAAYVESGEYGWVAASSLALFGEETLSVVTQALGPGLAATLVAEAMQPMAMPTIVLTLTVTP